MQVLSHITLKSKIHLLNYSGIWYTARHPHITEKYWRYIASPCKKILRAPLITFVDPIAKDHAHRRKALITKKVLKAKCNWFVILFNYR